MIKLTYDITDGGVLDQDGLVNGTIIDPVGLATGQLLAETGTDQRLHIPLALILIITTLAIAHRPKTKQSI